MHYYYYFCNVFNNLNRLYNNINKEHHILVSKDTNYNKHITIRPLDILKININKGRYKIEEINKEYTKDTLFKFFKDRIFSQEISLYNHQNENLNEDLNKDLDEKFNRLCVLFICIFYNRLELHEKLKNTRNKSMSDTKYSTKECKKYLTTLDYKNKFKTNNKIIFPSDYLCYDNGKSRKKFNIFSKHNQKFKIIDEYNELLKKNKDIDKAFKHFNKINNQLIEFIKYVKIILLKEYASIYDPLDKGTKQTIGTYTKTSVPSFLKKIGNPEYIKSDYLLHVEKMNKFDGKNQYPFNNNEFS